MKTYAPYLVGFLSFAAAIYGQGEDRPTGSNTTAGPRSSLLAANLAAGRWEACLAEVGREYAVPQEPTAREQREGVSPVPEPPIVRFGIRPVAMAAASAKALGGTATEEWGKKLYGSDPVGRKTYDAFLEMLDGDFTRLVPLIEDMDPALRARRQTFDWMGTAEMLEEAAGTKPERASWKAMAGAFRLLSVWRRPVWDEEKSVAMLEPFTKLPRDVRKKIVDAIVSYKGPLAERLRYSYSSKLPPLLRKKLVTDPELVRLLAHSLPSAHARAAMMSQMGKQPPEVVKEIAQIDLDLARDDDADALCAAANGFAQGGDRAEAITLLREGETKFGYPDRQRIRRLLFSMLRSESPSPSRPPRPGTGQSLSQFPALAEEIKQREAQAGLPAVELAMAKGDVYSMLGDSAKAGVAYGEAFGLATDATLQRIAWACWAGHDRKAAWAGREGLNAVFANANAETVPELAELACHVLGSGILVGEEEQALEWATSRLPALRKTPGGSRALGFLLLWRLLSADADPATVLRDADQDLVNLDDNSLLSLVDSFCGGSRISVHLAEGDVDQRLEKLLESRRNHPDWRVAASAALAVMPHFHDLRQGPYLWRKVLLACPVPSQPDGQADTLPKVEPISEEECQKLCMGVTESCIATLAKATPRDSALVVRNFLDVSSDMLQREGGKRFLSQAQALSLGAVAYSGEHSLRSRPIAQFLKRHVEGLRKCEAPEAMVQEYGSAVSKAFPDDRDIQQFLASLEAAPKP